MVNKVSLSYFIFSTMIRSIVGLYLIAFTAEFIENVCNKI